jgi:hypothetical protein
MLYTSIPAYDSFVHHGYHTVHANRLRCCLALFELPRVLVHLDHVAGFIENANQTIMRAMVELRVTSRVVD